MPDDAQPACAGCPLKGSCLLVRCPHCGYENPVAPAWLVRIRGFLGTRQVRLATRRATRAVHSPDTAHGPDTVRGPDAAPCAQETMSW